MFSEIDAYMRVMDVELQPWEVSLIHQLDTVFRSDNFHPAEFQPVGVSIKSFMENVKAKNEGKR